MRRRVLFLTVVLAGMAAAAATGRADRDELDEQRRQVLAAEDRRFTRTLELARIYVGLGRLEDARPLYEEALATRGDDTDVAEALLDVLRALGDYEAQLPLCRRLAASRPGDAKLHLETGVCLWRLERIPEARKTWEDLLRRFGADRTVYDDLVDVYIAEGRPADARDVLRRRRERFGEDADVLLIDARLALAEKVPDDACRALVACLERELSESDARRVEFLLLSLARETGRAAEVRARLEGNLHAVEGQLAGRLLELAGEAAGRGEFTAAATLGDRALPLITDPAARAEASSRVASWRARVPQ